MGRQSDSEDELVGRPALNQDQLDSLRSSAASISRDLKVLADEVAGMLAAVEQLGPLPDGANADRGPAAAPAPASTEAEDGMAIIVKVSPLPELAMAAVAETTLRNLPGVRQLGSVKREGDWAEFTLEVDPEIDLVGEMKVAMPVFFEVTESTPEVLTISLQWAWGTS